MKNSNSNSPFGNLNFSNIPVIGQLNSVQFEALKFGLSSVFLGTSSGLVFGSVTTLKWGLQYTPSGRANMIKSFKIFSLAGLVYGFTGSSLILIRGQDDYTNRLISGCSTGVSLGIYNRSFPVACFGCISLAALSAFSKVFEEGLEVKSELLQEISRPVMKKDEKW